MAKKSNRVVLEDIELKPQVIGYSYQKKSNIGRVIFIFIIFILAIYFINDISVYINNLIGKRSSESIVNLVNEKDNNIYYDINNNIEIEIDNIIISNFKYEKNKLVFDIYNTSKETSDFQNKNYYLEIYNDNKSLLEKHKIDILTITANSKASFEIDVTHDFKYITFKEK